MRQQINNPQQMRHKCPRPGLDRDNTLEPARTGYPELSYNDVQYFYQINNILELITLGSDRLAAGLAGWQRCQQLER